MIYTTKAYAKIQEYEQYFRYEEEPALFCFDIQGHTAISLPKSPVGGVCFFSEDQQEFENHWHELENQLVEKKVKEIILTISPDYYKGSVPATWLATIGATIETKEISQFLKLEGDLADKIHQMERRILNKPKLFEIREESPEWLEEIHTFIAHCRSQQDLVINIGLKPLKRLFETFPNNYQLFTARKNGQLIGAVVMVVPTDQIAYYFLPATDHDQKSANVMVHLIQYIYDYYQKRNFEYIDLGISSQNGEPQTSLIRFKENMGGILTSRNTWKKQLQ